MLKRLDSLPAGVLGYEADGKLHAADYKDILLPDVEKVIEEGGEVRMVLVFASWDGVSGGAMWQDLKLGVEHITKWKRIALVTDIDWMEHMTAVFGWMTPGDMKHFPLDQRDEAVAWAAADD